MEQTGSLEFKRKKGETPTNAPYDGALNLDRVSVPMTNSPKEQCELIRSEQSFSSGQALQKALGHKLEPPQHSSCSVEGQPCFGQENGQFEELKELSKSASGNHGYGSGDPSVVDGSQSKHR